jgi:tetratricopeptide (TPR) repeat protein
MLDITPNDLGVTVAKAGIYQAQGNLQEAARFLTGINEQTPNRHAFWRKFIQLRLERNYGEAIRLLQARLAQSHFNSDYEKSGVQAFLAVNQRLAGDMAGAKVTAEQARNILETLDRDQLTPIARAWLAVYLSEDYAAIGEKDLALKFAEQAVTLYPRAKDRVEGPTLEENLAVVQMMFGENSRAISNLRQLLETPYVSSCYGPASITPAHLRLDPIWDPLRSDPAFQKLCEDKQP